jgi:hypothetical protein
MHTEEDIGLECVVDQEMEIHGVTHARWVGAPPPMYCGNRPVGYWDHTTGLEVNEPPFKNKAGRSDTIGCCWWGRGVLQVRGICSYGKLNHWIGAKATAEKRKNLYPDIDFCKNPGAICTDKRSPELQWITGVFHWVQTVQRSRGDIQYFQTLKAFVDRGDYADKTFINMVNTLLGGTAEDSSKRSDTFFNILRAFNMITVEGDYTGTPVLSFCGVEFDDAGIKCTPCETKMNCSGMELCYDNVTTCSAKINDDNSALVGESTNASGAAVDDDNSTVAGESTNATGVASGEDNSKIASEPTNATTGVAPAVDDQSTKNLTVNTTFVGTADEATAPSIINSKACVVQDAPILPMSYPISFSTSFCGKTWGDALTNCAKRCEQFVTQ